MRTLRWYTLYILSYFWVNTKSVQSLLRHYWRPESLLSNYWVINELLLSNYCAITKLRYSLNASEIVYYQFLLLRKYCLELQNISCSIHYSAYCWEKVLKLFWFYMLGFCIVCSGLFGSIVFIHLSQAIFSVAYFWDDVNK